MKGFFLDRQKLRGAAWGRRPKLAQALGINPVSVSRKLNGHQRLTLEEINIIAKAIELDVTDFVHIREMD